MQLTEEPCCQEAVDMWSLVFLQTCSCWKVALPDLNCLSDNGLVWHIPLLQLYQVLQLNNEGTLTVHRFQHLLMLVLGIENVIGVGDLVPCHIHLQAINA